MYWSHCLSDPNNFVWAFSLWAVLEYWIKVVNWTITILAEYVFLYFLCSQVLRAVLYSCCSLWLWDVNFYSLVSCDTVYLVDRQQCFGGTSYLYLQCKRTIYFTLKIEPLSSPKQVIVYQTTWCHTKYCIIFPSSLLSQLLQGNTCSTFCHPYEVHKIIFRLQSLGFDTMQFGGDITNFWRNFMPLSSRYSVCQITDPHLPS
jgi:hypothetical protein